MEDTVDTMKEVTKEYFYSKVGPLDVLLSVIGPHPYTTEFKTRYRKVVAKSVDRLGIGDEDHIVTTYYTNL